MQNKVNNLFTSMGRCQTRRISSKAMAVLTVSTLQVFMVLSVLLNLGCNPGVGKQKISSSSLSLQYEPRYNIIIVYFIKFFADLMCWENSQVMKLLMHFVQTIYMHIYSDIISSYRTLDKSHNVDYKSVMLWLSIYLQRVSIFTG